MTASSAESLADRLEGPAARFGVVLSTDAITAMARFAEALLAWAPRINLTGVRSLDELADEHLADALAIVPHLPAYARVLDVGSGGGLPGIPLAIARPDLQLTLLEPRAKRVAFLRHALRLLSRTEDVRVVHGRLEEGGISLAEPDQEQPPGGFGIENEAEFDVALSRAVWPVPDWLSRGRRVVVPGGLVLGLEGGEPAGLPSDADRHPYEVAGRQRAVVTLRRARG